MWKHWIDLYTLFYGFVWSTVINLKFIITKSSNNFSLNKDPLKSTASGLFIILTASGESTEIIPSHLLQQIAAFELRDRSGVVVIEWYTCACEFIWGWMLLRSCFSCNMPPRYTMCIFVLVCPFALVPWMGSLSWNRGGGGGRPRGRRPQPVVSSSQWNSLSGCRQPSIKSKRWEMKRETNRCYV